MTGIVPLVDLRKQIGPVRDQGQRPTCLAFAASDAHAAARGEWNALSADYLYLRAQIISGNGTDQGSSLDAIMNVLHDDGQPTEAALPYASKPPIDLKTWKPPAGLTLYRRAGASSSPGAKDVRSDLDTGVPSIMLLMLSRSFYFASSNGLIDDVPGDPPDQERRHAVVAVGHGLLGERPLTLIRNSWGPEWAAQGYAWLTDEFLSPRLYATAKMMEDLSVSTYSDAA